MKIWWTWQMKAESNGLDKMFLDFVQKFLSYSFPLYLHQSHYPLFWNTVLICLLSVRGLCGKYEYHWSMKWALSASPFLFFSHLFQSQNTSWYFYVKEIVANESSSVEMKDKCSRIQKCSLTFGHRSVSLITLCSCRFIYSVYRLNISVCIQYVHLHVCALSSGGRMGVLLPRWTRWPDYEAVISNLIIW